MTPNKGLPLDGAQREAVEASGHCLIAACPEAGKARTLAAKAARILEDPSTRVAAVTFTRDAAVGRDQNEQAGQGHAHRGKV